MTSDQQSLQNNPKAINTVLLDVDGCLEKAALCNFVWRPVRVSAARREDLVLPFNRYVLNNLTVDITYEKKMHTSISDYLLPCMQIQFSFDSQEMSSLAFGMKYCTSVMIIICFKMNFIRIKMTCSHKNKSST